MNERFQSETEKSWEGKEHGLPPPLTQEFGAGETATWSGKEHGLPPPLPQEEEVDDQSKTQQQGAETHEPQHEAVPMPNIPLLDRTLSRLGIEGAEKKKQFVDEKRSLPPDALIDLYHGLNGGLRAALRVLESPDQGVRQISGPCLAVYPVGQFWKPGDAGFRYSIPRNLIEFPGERNEHAQFRMDEGGTVFLVNGRESLPLDEFSGEVMRSELKEDVLEEQLIDGEWKDVVVGERIVPLSDEEREAGIKVEEKLKLLAVAREEKATRSAAVVVAEQEKERIDQLRASIDATLTREA